MGAFVVYIIKSALCLSAFYIFYKFLMARDTFHRMNRIIILTCMILSCLVPLVKVSVKESTMVNQPMMNLEDFLIVSAEQTEGVADEVNWMAVLVLVYLLGTAYFLFRDVWSIGKLALFIRRCQVVKKENSCTLLTHTENIAPFSWMHYIIISKSDLEANGNVFIEHEKAHIRNGHSWDLLVAEIFTLLQWFNPASWLLKTELQNIHEYEADDSVLKKGIDAKTYQLLLIKKAAGTRLYSMANSFNHSSLKKRITMMLQKKSNTWAMAKCLFVLPVTAIAIAAFAHPEVDSLSGELSAITTEDLASTVDKVREIAPIEQVKGTKTLKEENDSIIFEVVDEQPEFPGGTGEMMKYISKTLKYPEDAFKNNVQGRVIVRFIITKDGSIKNPEVVRSVYPSLDAEAIRVISQMPKWTPGKQRGKAVNVRYVIPINFKLQGDDSDQTVLTRGELRKLDVAIRVLTNTDGEPTKPLYLVDGVEVSDLNSIAPKDIESIQVLKNDQAVSTYGERGKNGVVKVVTKHGKKSEDKMDEAFTVVEEFPEFPGGTGELMKYLAMNMKYPKDAHDNKIQGRVIVNFIISKDGTIKDPKVVHSVYPSLDKEAIRVVQEMPKWKPGKQRGEAVNVRFTIPISFRLSDDVKSQPIKLDEVMVVG